MENAVAIPEAAVVEEPAHDLFFLVNQEQRRVNTIMERHIKHADTYNDVLMNIKPTNLSINPGSLDISLAGTREDLVRVVRVLRRAGFLPSTKPKAGDTTYGTFWYGPENANGEQPTIWFYFTSTQCKRVQVGTETKQVPVYEVRCDDSLEALPEEV